MKLQFNIYLLKREYYKNNAFFLPLIHTIEKKEIRFAVSQKRTVWQSGSGWLS